MRADCAFVRKRWKIRRKLSDIARAARRKIGLNRLEAKTASNSNGTNRINVPQAKDALDNMKYEIARELGVNLKQGYNGDLTSREAGYVGGYMVKRLIEQAESQMAGQY